MASVYPAKITLHAIPEIVQKHNLLVDLLGKDLSSVVEGGGVGDVKSPIFPGAIDDTVVLFDGTSGKRIKASTIYAEWFDQSVATTADVVFSSVSAQSVILIQDTIDDDRDFPYLLGAMHPDSGYAFAARTTNANHYIEETLNLTSGVAATLRDIDLATNVSHFPSLTAGSVVAETVNELTLTAFETGFSVSGGDTSKTITVPDNATVSGTNTGDQDLSPYALKTNVLELDNTDAYVPTTNYHPATKKYVDDEISGAAHYPVTIGTPANGLSLSTQELSIALSGVATTGALSSTDWNIFNDKQDALTFGIANTNALQVDDATAADNDYAKFTATGLEGVPYSTVLSDIGALPTSHLTDFVHADIAHTNRAALDLVSGTNTGDQSASDFNHDDLSNIPVNDHIDWTAASAGTIHATNYVDNDTTYTAGTGLDLTGTVFSNTDLGSAAVSTHESSYNHSLLHSPVTLGVSANGLSLSGQELSLGLASAIANGALSSTDWSAFDGKQDTLIADTDYLTPATAASTYATPDIVDNTAYGVEWDTDTTHAPSKNAIYDKIESLPGGHDAVTIGVPANGLSLSGQEISLALASTSTIGALSDTDWNTFNGKQDALTFGIANTNAVDIDSASVASGEYARFTANGLESRSTSEVLSDIGAEASINIGNRTYTEDNYVTDSESVTSSIDALDIAVKNNADAIIAAAPACQAYRSSNQPIGNASLTTIALNAVRYDPAGMLGSSKITIAKAGTYVISANVQFDSNATGIRSVRITLNGSTIIGMIQTPSNSGATTVLSASAIHNLSATDYLELVVYQTSGGSLNVQYTAALSPNLSVARIG